MQSYWKHLRSWEGFLCLVLLMTISVNAVNSDAFLSIDNQINLFALSIEKVIIALIMAFIIINAEIDLSVASMMGLAACALGWMVDAGASMATALALCLLIGIAGGVIQRLLDYFHETALFGSHPCDANWLPRPS